MKRKRIFIIGLTAAIVALCAGLGGTALANDNDREDRSDSLLGRVAEILGIDREQVEDAFAQARSELAEERAENRFEGLLDEEQAAEFREWLESRPDMSEYREKMKEWMESMPDLPDGTVFRHFRVHPKMGEGSENTERCIPFQ